MGGPLGGQVKPLRRRAKRRALAERTAHQSALAWLSGFSHTLPSQTTSASAPVA